MIDGSFFFWSIIEAQYFLYKEASLCIKKLSKLNYGIKAVLHIFCQLHINSWLFYYVFIFILKPDDTF